MTFTPLPRLTHPLGAGEPIAPSASLGELTEWCAHWKAMDAHYLTPAGSPLHHDNRCAHCHPTPREQFARLMARARVARLAKR